MRSYDMSNLYEQIDLARKFTAEKGIAPINESARLGTPERLAEQSTVGLGWASRQQPVQEETVERKPLGAYPIAN
jgi:hypothetical protein